MGYRFYVYFLFFFEIFSSLNSYTATGKEKACDENHASTTDNVNSELKWNVISKKFNLGTLNELLSFWLYHSFYAIECFMKVCLNEFRLNYSTCTKFAQRSPLGPSRKPVLHVFQIFFHLSMRFCTFIFFILTQISEFLF